MANQKNINAKAADVENLQKRFDTVVLGVLFVVLIAVLSPIIDAWRFRAASYEALDKWVSEQNKIIEDLRDEVKDLNVVLGVKKTTEITIPDSINVKKSFSIEGD